MKTLPAKQFANFLLLADKLRLLYSVSVAGFYFSLSWHKEKITKEKSRQTRSLRAFCLACPLSIFFCKGFWLGPGPCWVFWPTTPSRPGGVFTSNLNVLWTVAVKPRRIFLHNQKRPLAVLVFSPTTEAGAIVLWRPLLPNNFQPIISCGRVCVWVTPLVLQAFTFLCLDTIKS